MTSSNAAQLTSAEFPLVTVDTGLWPTDSIAFLLPPTAIPEPYKELLAHHHHMTVTVEAFYNSPVHVRVLSSGRNGDAYYRHILLELEADRRIVQYGIVRIDLACCTSEVREAILEEKTPLGRILIEHNVLRRIEPTSFLAIEPGPTLENALDLQESCRLFGRTGVIFCDNRPAIAVLEILAPIPD